MEVTRKERLVAVLAAYGADPARWPEADRRNLAAHLAEEGEAMAAAQALDRLLASAPKAAPGEDFVARVMARIDDGAREPAPRARRMGLGWGSAIPLAASLILGAYLGAAGDLDALLPLAVTDAGVDDGGDPAGVAGVTDYSPETLG